MNHDPIVAEIRQTRARLLAECGGDLDRLLDRYKSKEDEDRERVVTPQDVESRRRSASQSQPTP